MTDDRFLRMSTPELERRWALVRGLIADRGLDAVLTLCSDDDMGGYVRWLTDGPVLPYRRGVLFARDGAMAVVEHGGQGAHRAPHPGDANYRGITDIWGVAEFPVVDYSLHYEAEVVVAEIRRRDYRRIALVGAGNMPHRFVSHIEEALSGTVTFSDETAAFDGFMVVKSEEEQAAICRAAALQDELMALALRTIRPGLLEAELTATLRAHAQARGAEGGIILAGSGPQGTFAPFKPIARQNRHIEPGDVVALLVENSGPGGYFTEIARNFVVGKAEAVVAEAIRGGLQAVPAGQSEGAAALGLTYWQTSLLIVVPQALRHAIPAMANLFIGLFKDTSLVGIVGLTDLLLAAKQALGDPQWRQFSLEGYAFVALIYVAFCFFISRYSRSLEHRLRREHH